MEGHHARPCAILERCLDPDPDQRYQRGRELAEDLDRWRAGRPLLCLDRTVLGLHRAANLETQAQADCYRGVIAGYDSHHDSRRVRQVRKDSAGPRFAQDRPALGRPDPTLPISEDKFSALLQADDWRASRQPLVL